MTQRRTALLLLVFLISTGCNGPLPFLSGGRLGGETRPAPPIWNLEEPFGVAQLETRPADPYSVNVAYTQLGGVLYLNAGDTETEWVKHITADPRVRLRIDDEIFELAATRVRDPAEIEAFGQAWTDQGFFHRDPTKLDRVWLYRLAARADTPHRVEP